MASHREPFYITAFKSGLLKERVRQAYSLLDSCILCGHYCKVNRNKGETGFCRTGNKLKVSSFGAHHGEEEPISGRRGSGTIFLTNCNLGCVFCQNYDISQLGEGSLYTVQKLASIMLHLQNAGCHNINLVTPTHQTPMLLDAIYAAAEKGLHIPLVWNCGGYESTEVLSILDGLVDIYMPDFKYWDDEPALMYSKAPHYGETARAAIKEMHRQTGDLVMDQKGTAYRGLLIRHLILPENLAGTISLVNWLKNEISPNTYINIMSQYHPCYNAFHYEKINRRPKNSEFLNAKKYAVEAGLRVDK